MRKDILNPRVLAVLIGLLIFCFSCTDDSDSPVDPEPAEIPSIVLTNPVNGQSVYDFIVAEVEAHDDVGIAKVDFYFDGEYIYYDAVPPYEHLFNVSALKHQSVHTVYAVMIDTDGNNLGSKVVYITVDTTLGTPPPPVLTAFEQPQGHNISIAWSANNEPDFLRYNIYFDSLKPSGDLENFIGFNDKSADTTFVIEGLYDNSDYYFQVEVSDRFQKKSRSNILKIKTADVAPPEPVIYFVKDYEGYKELIWKKIDIKDFYATRLIQSKDTLYDLYDYILATFYLDQVTSHSFAANDYDQYYYFVLVDDTAGNSSISRHFPIPGGNGVNYALSFDGTSYTTTPFFENLNLGPKYTLEAWVCQTGVNKKGRIIDRSSEGDPYYQYSLYSDTSLGASFCRNDTYYTYQIPTKLNLNEWHHIAFSVEETYMRFYIDGVQVRSYHSNTNYVCETDTDLSIGRRILFDEFYFKGMIDEIRIWDTNRAAVDILNNYNKPLTGSEDHLVLYYNFDEGAGDIITSPVGGNGYLGSTPEKDSADPDWVLSGVPF